jgi:hypothetical protein
VRFPFVPGEPPSDLDVAPDLEDVRAIVAPAAKALGDLPVTPPLAETGPRAVASLLEAVRPWRSPVTFPDFLGRNSTPAEVQAAWPDQSRARLLDIKQGWDLDNVFRVGHALLPAPAETR